MLLVVFGVAGQAQALSVRIDHPNGGTIPEFIYMNGSSLPLELTLQLANDATVDSEPVFVWQVGLQLQGASTAQGELLFESMAVPDDSLFGSYSAPMPPINAPTSQVVINDADLLPAMPVVPAESSRNILRLGFAASDDAEGLFSVTMLEFDLVDYDHSSSWIPWGDEAPPTPFDNVPNSDDPPGIVLATIRVVPIPEPAGVLLLLVGCGLSAPFSAAKRHTTMRRASIP